MPCDSLLFDFFGGLLVHIFWTLVLPLSRSCRDKWVCPLLKETEEWLVCFASWSVTACGRDSVCVGQIRILEMASVFEGFLRWESTVSRYHQREFRESVKLSLVDRGHGSDCFQLANRKPPHKTAHHRIPLTTHHTMYITHSAQHTTHTTYTTYIHICSFSR